MRDKANFFGLSEEEQKQLKEDSEISIDDNGNIVEKGHKLKKYYGRFTAVCIWISKKYRKRY